MTTQFPIQTVFGASSQAVSVLVPIELWRQVEARQGIDLSARSISPEQAGELRASLSTFTDWDDPQMDVYDDYDAASHS